jgi:cell division protein FtsN
MKRSGFIFFALFIAAAVFLVVATWVLPESQSDIILEDISPAVAPHTSPKESLTRKTTPIDNTKTGGDDKLQVDYYIIVGSYRNLKQAQQKAEKLINDFNANIILLPPTAEGYYRISYGKYSTLEETKSTIKSIRTNISSDPWIFSVKK